MRTRRTLLLLGVMLALLCIQALFLKALPGSVVRVYCTESIDDFNQPPDTNMTVTFDRYPFDYRIHPGIADDDRAAVMKALTGSGREGMAGLLAIAHWVRGTMSFGSARAPSQKDERGPSHAEQVVGERRGLCDGYARLFAASCQAAGIPARIIELNGHVVPEAFLEKMGRWVMVDPTLGYYMTENGIPLSVIEIIRAYRDGRPPIPTVFAATRGNDSIYLPEEEETLRGIYLNGFTVVSNQHLQPLRLLESIMMSSDLPVAQVQYLEGHSPRLGRKESILRVTLVLSIIFALLFAVRAVKGSRRRTPVP